MNPQRRTTARSVQADLLPARLCLELPGRAEKPAHVILAVSATGDAGVAASLAGEWLASVFGQRFTEDRNGERSLGIEAFYDALSYQIGGRAFVAAIGLEESSTAHAASRPATSPATRLEIANEGDPIRLQFQGIAHALLNRASGRVLVTFDHLPGAIELVGKAAPALRFDAQTASREATAWYGFGTVTRQSRTRRSLRSGIRHGVVEVRSGPAAVLSAR